MRRVLLFMTPIVIATFLSCSKKENIRPESHEGPVSAGSASYLSLSEEEYENLKLRLKKDFEDTTQNLKLQAVDFEDKELAVKLSKDFSVKRTQNILKKYPELSGFKSLLSVYNDALGLSDTNKLKDIAKAHPSFILYVKGLHTVLLTLPFEEAAILSPEGNIKIGGDLTKQVVEALPSGKASQRLEETEYYTETYWTDGFYAMSNQQSISYKIKPTVCGIVTLPYFEYTFFASAVTGVHGYGPLASHVIIINTRADYVYSYFPYPSSNMSFGMLNGTNGLTYATNTAIRVRPEGYTSCSDNFKQTLGGYYMTSTVTAIYANGVQKDHTF